MVLLNPETADGDNSDRSRTLCDRVFVGQE